MDLNFSYMREEFASIRQDIIELSTIMNVFEAYHRGKRQDDMNQD